MNFPGFPEEVTGYIRIPEQFFRHALLNIDNLSELKLIMYIFWRLERLEGPFRYLRFTELAQDAQLVQSMGKDPERAHSNLVTDLRRAVKHGTLLQAEIPGDGEQERIICLNSPRGRAAMDAIRRGEWRSTDNRDQPIEIYIERPNIFQLYESNIGPLTPLIADALRDAQKTSQANWIEDAFRIAVERNKRNWHYVEAILHRWQEEGRDDRKNQQDRRNDEKTRRRYSDWER